MNQIFQNTNNKTDNKDKKDNKKLQNVIKFTIRDTKFKKVYEK